jgi:hypothetical protein
MLPASISSLLAIAPAVGFSGSRAPSRSSVAAARAAVAAVAAPILVGDARGIDAVVRSARADARIFRVADYGTGDGAFAARSIACVRAVACGGVFAAFPAAPCPAGLRPSSAASACFAGFSAGTWSSLAFALGLGLAAVVYLPEGIEPPAAFGLVSVGAGWWLAAPPAQQLTLF